MQDFMSLDERYIDDYLYLATVLKIDIRLKKYLNSVGEWEMDELLVRIWFSGLVSYTLALHCLVTTGRTSNSKGPFY